MAIEFGIFDHIEMHSDRGAENVYEERIASLKRAEQGGFYAFHLAEHGTEFQWGLLRIGQHRRCRHARRRGRIGP